MIALLAPLWGALLDGIQRKLKARMQRRIGPPILQPYYDMIKLFEKATFIVNEKHIWLGILYFFTLWLAIIVLFTGGDILYVVYIHLLASIFYILAGFSVRSIFSNLGSNRKLLTLVAYEPVLIIAVISIALHYESFSIDTIVNSSNSFWALLISFVSLVFIVPMITKLSPFDAAKAHQEIVGGIEIEYGGVFYEIIYMTKFMEMIFIYALIFILFGSYSLIGLCAIVLTFLLVNLIDNSTTRIKINDLVKVTYMIALPLSVLGLLVVVL